MDRGFKLQHKGKPAMGQLLAQLLRQSPDVADKRVYFFFEALPADPDDNKFVDAYLAAGADYLVPWDNHFSSLRKTTFPKVKVVDPDEFVRIITPSPSGFVAEPA